jgi:glycopeptide antibiotics resistance protein
MSFARRIPVWFWWAVVIWLVCLPWPGMAPQANSEVQFVPFAGKADGLRDIVANIVLFLPLGYLFAAAHPRRGFGVLVTVAVAVSLTAETLQLLSPARFPSATDVVVNTGGAFVGGWLRRALGAGRR